MSKPSNRLSAFRSYSYYHVLVMCDSSNTADLLTKDNNPDVWHYTTDETKAADDRPGAQDLGKYSPKCIRDANNKCIGRYIVLVDGAVDAAFSITQVKLTSATAASAVHADMNTSLAVEGSLSILEPKGVAFLDQVVRCSVALGVDNSQVVYCLKTFFVGYTYDPAEGDKPESITDVPPISFIAYDVTGSFTEQGGFYEMLFVAVANGAARLPQYSKAVNSMNIKAGETLAATLTNLQTNIRTGYDRYYACVVKQLEEMGTPESISLKNSLCPVTYTIEVGDDYKKDSSYVVTDKPTQQSDMGICGEPAKFTFPPNTSIETAISEIMRACPKVKDDMAVGDTSDKVKYEYKIHSCVKSTPVSGSDVNAGKMSYEVVYRVERFITPKTIAYDSGFATFAQDEDEIRNEKNYNMLRRNIIEFDYLYTGNNIDILEFDLKVNMGLAYLQTATLANTFKGQLERTANTVQSLSGNNASLNMNGRLIPGVSVQTPVFFGKQIVNPKVLNTNDANSTIQSVYTLAKHASLEVAEAKVRIVGNDRMLATVGRATSAGGMMSGRPAVDTSSLPNDEADFKYWGYVPAYVKINIKMPRDNDDFSLFTGQMSPDGTSVLSNADYAREFWFDGYYYVVGIEHIFDNGEFTQILDMVSIPKASAFGSTKTSPKEASFDVRVGECFDSQTGCGKTPATGGASGTSTKTIPPVANTPPTTEPEPPLTKNDAESVLSAPTSLEKVKGWTKASPEVKNAIIKAGKEYGIDPVVLAQFCYQESKFNPTAKSSTSSATGLFQFIDGTWSKSTLGTDHNITEAVLADKTKRLDPQLNSYAAARYLNKNKTIIGSDKVGDLYLAHFLGAGSAATKSGAWAIINADKSTNGTATLAETLGRKKADKIAKYNSPYITSNMTVRQLREWAASKMANTLTSPITTVKPFSAAKPISLQEDLLVKDQLKNFAVKSATRESPPIVKQKIAAQQNCKVQEEEQKNKDKTSCAKKEELDRRAKGAETAGGGQTSDEMNTGN